MEPVKEGDRVSIKGKAYVFTKGTANLFNIALTLKNREGIWPEGNFALKNVAKLGVKYYYRPACFDIPIIAKAVEKAQR